MKLPFIVLVICILAAFENLFVFVAGIDERDGDHRCKTESTESRYLRGIMCAFSALMMAICIYVLWTYNFIL